MNFGGLKLTKFKVICFLFFPSFSLVLLGSDSQSALFVRVSPVPLSPPGSRLVITSTTPAYYKFSPFNTSNEARKQSHVFSFLSDAVARWRCLRCRSSRGPYCGRAVRHSTVSAAAPAERYSGPDSLPDRHLLLPPMALQVGFSPCSALLHFALPWSLDLYSQDPPSPQSLRTNGTHARTNLSATVSRHGISNKQELVPWNTTKPKFWALETAVELRTKPLHTHTRPHTLSVLFCSQQPSASRSFSPSLCVYFFLYLFSLPSPLWRTSCLLPRLRVTRCTRLPSKSSPRSWWRSC